MEPLQTELERHQRIELAAYYLWKQRGCPIGEPEVDWFRAEKHLNEQLTSSITAAAAEVVGSVLGSAAGVAATLGRIVHSED